MGSVDGDSAWPGRSSFSARSVNQNLSSSSRALEIKVHLVQFRLCTSLLRNSAQTKCSGHCNFLFWLTKHTAYGIDHADHLLSKQC